MTELRQVYSVPTHLAQREPMVFGRTVSELAKLLVMGFVAARLVSASDLPTPVRFGGAGLLLLIGVAWALVRIQGYSLDGWLGLAFRFGARPKRRVWRPHHFARTDAQESPLGHAQHCWFEVERVRLRWAPEPDDLVCETAVLSASGATRPGMQNA